MEKLYMEQKLRIYQRDAVKEILMFFHSDDYKGKMYLSAGLGKSMIITTALKKIFENVRYFNTHFVNKTGNL